jgi:hypothetical protein
MNGFIPAILLRVSISCSASDTRLVNLVKNLVISQEWGKDMEVFTNNRISTRFAEHIIRTGHATFGGIVLLDL